MNGDFLFPFGHRNPRRRVAGCAESNSESDAADKSPLSSRHAPSGHYQR